MSSQNYRNGVQEWDEKLAQCPYYPSHQIRPTRFGHHLLQCRSFLVSKLLTFRSALLFMWQVRKCKALEAYFFFVFGIMLAYFFLSHFVITTFSEVKICPKVFNRPEFHFSEVYFFQTWYFSLNFKFCFFQVCKFNSFHHIPRGRMEEHIKKCQGSVTVLKEKPFVPKVGTVDDGISNIMTGTFLLAVLD